MCKILIILPQCVRNTNKLNTQSQDIKISKIHTIYKARIIVLHKRNNKQQPTSIDFCRLLLQCQTRSTPTGNLQLRSTISKILLKRDLINLGPNIKHAKLDSISTNYLILTITVLSGINIQL